MDLSNVHSLDTIFFSGNNMISKVIKMSEFIILGKGTWSHVGIAIQKKYIPSIQNDDDPETMYIWESTLEFTNNIKDITDNVICGIQLRKLKGVVDAYRKEGYKIGVGILNHNPLNRQCNEQQNNYEKRINLIKQCFDSLYLKYNHKPYQMNICRLVGSLSKWLLL